ncbi:MAG: methylation-associated defense system protein MAD7 [Candidatus Acidiferrales bacterium]
MALGKKDTVFRSTKVSHIDFKFLHMDRVLTALFARLQHDGSTSRLTRNFELTTERFFQEFAAKPEVCIGFEENREIVEKWIETHLMDVVNRGRWNQAIASPRPLHGFTYRFRNPKHSRDYNASQHLYWMLYYARNNKGPAALNELKRFFFAGVDPQTGQLESSGNIDVETQALLRFSEQVKDAKDTSSKDERFPPLCIGQADLLADDVLRLMAYQRFVPRSVMVEYIKILLSFHLALFHLRLFKLLPAVVKKQSAEPLCETKNCPMSPSNSRDPHGDCPFRIGILVDVANQPATVMQRLAAQSAEAHYRRIPAFIKANFVIKKLDEFADYLSNLPGKFPKPPSGWFRVADLLALLSPRYKVDRDAWFGQRLAGVHQDLTDGGEEALLPEIQAIFELGLERFETYIEILVAYRATYHRGFLTRFLDSALLKNDSGALIAQSRTKGAARRFILDSRLLEVLIQIAVLRSVPETGRFYTSPDVRIEDLLDFFRERYGIHIDRLPSGDGFSGESITDREALRANTDSFKARLRELGFYRDLSDAYIVQTVKPRYTIRTEGMPPGALL